ncbi:HD-GYP domain-containing protein (c-di-GMP phosphodiesterase class II) [Paenibacillus taihuensis]|uniref:HD-GYP domain-containing protein (C-di-GMP phosphodiesterase class II) n=1 Tax=Paenibacillus taihuensis TaxID=1156355 RepID=A0A3D9SC27_9BACL|nr:HD domain-containing phosphohydrolase [Paenibacillus taihuensis]REE90535.1 HD-GYP domain-containing protein (c-di-GMP phosphodiesterase class II) [Paenibacillus taihuensis]
MKYVDMEAVESGDVLGKTIYAVNGQVLLSANVQMTVYMISTLKRIGITNIYIKDASMPDIEEQEEILSEETKRAIIKQMSETMDAIRSGKDFNSRSVSLVIDDLLDDVIRNKEVLIHLNDIRTRDNMEYLHAMNVCMMSTLLGVGMHLNQIQLKELAIGALLHDVGKPDLVPPDGDIEPKRHTWRGFELLKSKREFSLLIAHVAFQHHEHVDGTGVPRGLNREQIHLYSRIVAVTNMYDNLLQTGGESGGPLLPHEACERMMAMSGTILDHEILTQFLRAVSIYPNGVSVKLSTKETGIVVGQHRGLPGRPIVRLLERESTRENDNVASREIDLAKHTTVFIEQVLG